MKRLLLALLLACSMVACGAERMITVTNPSTGEVTTVAAPTARRAAADALDDFSIVFDGYVDMLADVRQSGLVPDETLNSIQQINLRVLDIGEQAADALLESTDDQTALDSLETLNNQLDELAGTLPASLAGASAVIASAQGYVSVALAVIRSMIEGGGQ